MVFNKLKRCFISCLTIASVFRLTAFKTPLALLTPVPSLTSVYEEEGISLHNFRTQHGSRWASSRGDRSSCTRSLPSPHLTPMAFDSKRMWGSHIVLTFFGSSQCKTSWTSFSVIPSSLIQDYFFEYLSLQRQLFRFASIRVPCSNHLQ